MPRRSKAKSQKRDWRFYMSLVLNGAVALSMVVGTVFIFGGAPTPQQSVPTLEVPTLAPTTVPVPSATPAARAGDFIQPDKSGWINIAVPGNSRDGDII